MIVNITATLQMRGTALQTHAGSAKAAIGKHAYCHQLNVNNT